MIKFIIDESEKELPTFGDVEIGQFFVSSSGNLCQKIHRTIAHTIADSSGKPAGNSFNGWKDEHHVVRILPKVTKIEF